MITFYVPTDKDLLTAFGEVALRHEHLNYILRMTIKTLARLEVVEALDETAYDGSRQLRDRIRKLASQRLGEGDPLMKLQALLERCRRATNRRNELMHGIWAQELDGKALRRGRDHNWHSLPTTEELLALAMDIQILTEELNKARLDGYLFDALSKRPVTHTILAKS